MTIYKIGWTLIDGIDGKIRGSDRMWFDKEPDEHNALWRLDRVVELGGQVGETIARNFYWEHIRSSAPKDFKIRYIKVDRFRKGDIALIAGKTKIRINQVRGNIVIGRTFGIGNSESKYFLKDLVLVQAREEEIK